MSIGYYPGCALHGTSKEYDQSITKVNEALGVDIKEVEDWNCCGASSGHMTNHNLTVALNARNLILCEEQNLNEIVAPCPLCSKVMLETDKELQENQELHNEIAEVIGKKYNASVHTLNYLQFVEKYYLDKLKDKITYTLEGVKAACYYGCLLTRPPDIVKFDDAEQPTSMEQIAKVLSVETVEWNFKTECCGGGLALSRTDIVTNLCRKIIKDAQGNGADFIIAACPMCHSNLDLRQGNIAETFGIRFNIPIIYLSELIGLLIGIPAKELGLQKHIVDCSPVISKLKKIK